MKNNQEEIIKQLISYAYEKMEKNNAYPFCAFIVKNNVIVSRGYNSRVNLYGDITTHGEMEVIRKACRALHQGIHLGSDYHLYSTCEPCLACFDTALWAGIRTFTISVDHLDFPDYFHKHPYQISDYEKDNPGEIHVYRKLCIDDGKKLFQTAKQKYGW